MCFSLVPHEIVGTDLYSTGMGVINTIYGAGNAISGPLGGKLQLKWALAIPYMELVMLDADLKEVSNNWIGRDQFHKWSE